MTGPVVTPFDDDDRRRPVRPPVATPFDDDAVAEQQASAALGGAMQDARMRSPKDYADAFRIGQRMGLHPDIIGRNIEAVRADESATLPTDPFTFRRESPRTASWVMDDTANGAVSNDDWENLGFIERVIGRDWQMLNLPGGLTVPIPARPGTALVEGFASGLQARADRLRGRAGAKWQESAAAPEIRRLDAEVERQRASVPPAQSFLERMVRGTTGALTGSLVEGGRGTIEGAAVGAGTFGLAGAVAGPAGAAAGATAGGAAGAPIGRYNALREMMKGMMLSQLETVERENGVEIPDAVKEDVADGVSVLGGLAEFIGLRFVTRGLLARGAARALASPTVARAVSRGLVGYGENVGAEILTENVQQGLSLYGEHVAREDVGLEGVSGERVRRELAETTIETAISMALVPLPGLGVSLMDGAMQVRQAREAQDRMAALGEGAKASKLRERSPEAFRSWAEAVTRDGALSEVYVPAERFDALFQAEGFDPEGVAAEAGIGEAYRQSVLTGADVAIPLETYVARFAGTDWHAKLLPDLKLRRDALTGREADKVERELDKLSEEVEAVEVGSVTDQNERAVVELLTAALSATGTYTDEQVRTQVEVLAKPYLVMARRFAAEQPEHRWANPLTIWRDRGIKVLGPDRAEAMYDTQRRLKDAKPGEAEGLDLMLRRITDERVDLRTALRTLEQTADVRDESGRLRDSYARVSDEALVLEFIAQRDAASQARSRAMAIEETPEFMAAHESATVEEASAAIAETAMASGIESLSGVDQWLGLRTQLRTLEREAGRAERVLPRLERELTARGITNPDGYAEERGFGLDSTFDPETLEQATPEPTRTSAQLARVAPWQMTRDEYYGRSTGTPQFYEHGTSTEAAERIAEQGITTGEAAAAFERIRHEGRIVPAAIAHTFGEFRGGADKGKVLVFRRTQMERDGIGIKEGAKPIAVVESGTPTHEQIVRQAIADGKAVPEPVRAEYDVLDQSRSEAPLVRDESGRVRTMYHGSESGTPTFSGDEIAWFTNDKGHAKEYADDGPVISVHLRAGRILDLPELLPDVEDLDEITWKEFQERTGLPLAGHVDAKLLASKKPDRLVLIVNDERTLAAMRAAGYDGVKLLEQSGQYETIGVFSPEQVEVVGAKKARGQLLEQAEPASEADADTFNAVEAHEIRAEQPNTSARDIATMVGATVAQVEAWLAAPKPTLSREQMFRVAFNQREKGRPNAFYQQQDRLTRIVGLMETANLSSFAHEMGHEYLALLDAAAKQDGAPQTVKDDLATVLKRLNAPDFASLTRAQQEKFARDFEAYLLKGEAPTRDLARAFTRFRVWLTNVYRAVKAMLTRPVSPELAAVFDRLLATEDEMVAWKASPENAPLWETAEAAGMSESIFAAYRAKYDWNAVSVEQRIVKDILYETTDERRTAWQEMESGVRSDVEAAVAKEPAERAVRYLRDGLQPDGTTGEPTLLDRVSLTAQYGTGSDKTVPRGTLAKKGTDGANLDAVAETLGWSDAASLFDALQRYEPYQKRVDRLTNQVMRERFPDLLGDSAALTQAATDAGHRAEQDDGLLAELKQLGTTLGIEAPSLPAVKMAVERLIGQTTVRDLQPHRFLLAERKAARAAEKEARKAKPDVGIVHQEKRRQLLNRLLYREARKAEARADKVAAFFRRMADTVAQERLGLAGAHHRDAMDALLDGHEFRPVSGRRLDRRAGLRSYAERVAAESEGLVPLSVPQALLDEADRVNYREMTVEALDGLHEAGQQVWGLATMKEKLLAQAEKRAVKEVAEAAAESIASFRELIPREYVAKADQTALDKVGALADKMNAALLKPEMILRVLDGDRPNGPVQQALMRRFSTAQQARSERLRLEAPRVVEALAVLTPKRRKATVKIAGRPRPISIETAFTIALNMGNDGNAEALFKGVVDGRTAWTPAQVQQAMSALTAAELRAVQGVWDYVGSFWPEIAAQKERFVGVKPEQVEARPLTVRSSDGETVLLKGGYYPLSYDSRYNTKLAAAEEVASLVSEGKPVGSGTWAATKHGHDQERVGSGNKPVRLDLGVLSQHVYAVVHDLTHREAVYDVQRLLNQPSLKGAIEQATGPASYQELLRWVRRVAGEPPGPAGILDNLLTQARTGTTAVALGMKATTTLLQITGLIPAMDLVGVKWVARGMKEYVASERGTTNHLTEMVHELSAEMRNRAANMDREIRDAARRKGALNEKDSLIFWTIMRADQVVSVGVWWGAYQKELAKGVPPVDAIEAADSAIRLTQGANAAKDLSSAAAGGPLQKMFTMFYSYGSALYGLFYRANRNVREGRWGIGRLFGSMLLTWILPSVIEPFLTGRAPDSDEDDDALAWWFWNIATYPTQAVPLLRDAARYAKNRVTGEGIADLEVAPVEGSVQTAIRATEALVTAPFDDEPLTESEAKAMVNTVGFFLKLPTQQMWTTGSYMHDWMMGYDVPEGPTEATRNLLFTRPR